MQKVRESAKALVAGATPLVSAFVTDVLAELSTRATIGIAAGSALLVTWLVPNKPASEAPA